MNEPVVSPWGADSGARNMLFHRVFDRNGMAVQEMVFDTNKEGERVLIWCRRPWALAVVDGKANPFVHVTFDSAPDQAIAAVAKEFDRIWAGHLANDVAKRILEAHKEELNRRRGREANPE